MSVKMDIIFFVCKKKTWRILKVEFFQPGPIKNRSYPMNSVHRLRFFLLAWVNIKFMRYYLFLHKLQALFIMHGNPSYTYMYNCMFFAYSMEILPIYINVFSLHNAWKSFLYISYVLHNPWKSFQYIFPMFCIKHGNPSYIHPVFCIAHGNPSYISVFWIRIRSDLYYRPESGSGSKSRYGGR